MTDPAEILRLSESVPAPISTRYYDEGGAVLIDGDSGPCVAVVPIRRGEPAADRAEYLCLAANAAPALAREVLEARALLRRVEWSATVAFGPPPGGWPACPCCRAMKSDGHKAGCELATFLEGKS